MALEPFSPNGDPYRLTPPNPQYKGINVPNNDRRATAATSLTKTEYTQLKNHALHAEKTTSAFMREALNAYMGVRSRKLGLDFSVDPIERRRATTNESGEVAGETSTLQFVKLTEVN